MLPVLHYHGAVSINEVLVRVCEARVLLRSLVRTSHMLSIAFIGIAQKFKDVRRYDEAWLYSVMIE